jgi:hypothetical protein
MNREKGTWLATRPSARNGAKSRAEGVGFDGPATAFLGRLEGLPSILPGSSVVEASALRQKIFGTPPRGRAEYRAISAESVPKYGSMHLHF